MKLYRIKSSKPKLLKNFWGKFMNCLVVLGFGIYSVLIPVERLPFH